MSLVVEGLTKRYGEKTVVDNLTFAMHEPGVYALLGTNGAGKTTSLRMMLGMLAKDGGTALWNGKPLSSRTCNVGYLAEERGLYPKYTLMDQLIYFAALRGVPKEEARNRIRYWAKRLEVEEYLYQTPPEENPAEAAADLPAAENIQAAENLRAAGEQETGGRKRGRGKADGRSRRRKAKGQKPKLADQLSKGNQQKIQFMIALLSRPELLILDEPLSGLDPVNTDLLKSVIREEIDRGAYLIMSSHQMATVEEFCTDLTILDHAETVLQGNLNEIKKSYGRVNLRLKTEGDATAYIEKAGGRLLSRNAWEYQLKVTGEAQANSLLASLIEAGITVVAFELREPSLHEIFVEKVGERHV